MSKAYFLVAIIYVLAVIVAPCPGPEKILPSNLITVAPTPYKDNGMLNLAAVPQLAKYYAKNNLTNVFVLEYDGGGATLMLRERMALVQAWVKQARKYGFNIICETGLQTFVESLILASYCSQQNVAVITHFPEQIYQAHTVQEAIQELKWISQAAPNISLVYNELLTTDPEISTDQVMLAGDQVPTFTGVETTMNTYWKIKAVNSTKNRTVWIYDIQNMYGALLQGLGSVTLGPNIAPKIATAMETAANNGDRKTGRKLQMKMNKIVAGITNLDGGTLNLNTRTYYSNMKAAIQLITCINLGARVPFIKADPDTYQKIASNLRSLGYSLPNCRSGRQNKNNQKQSTYT